MQTVFKLLDMIERGVSSDKDVTIINKSGRFIKGDLYDHYVRLSADKLRGKIRVRLAKDQQEVEVDANDILDIQIS